jgi:hypothetical protein
MDRVWILATNPSRNTFRPSVNLFDVGGRPWSRERMERPFHPATEGDLHQRFDV